VALALTLALDPARMAVRIQLDGIPAGADTYTIERKAPSGNVAAVRGADGAVVTGASAVVRDYEAPFDLDLVYTAWVYDGATALETTSAPFRVEYGDCPAWLVDLARPTNSLVVTIESLRELAFGVAAGVHRVLARRAPVMTTLPAWTPTSELVTVHRTLAERDRMRALLGSGYPVLLRTSPEQGIGNMYLGVAGFVEERIFTLGDADERRFRTSVVQVERPDPGVFVPTPPNTYAVVTATYATYAEMQAAVGTYDGLAYTYPDDPEAAPITPWLPDDV